MQSGAFFSRAAPATAGSNGITITSRQTAQMGHVATEVEFGAGYTYRVLVDEGCNQEAAVIEAHI